MKTLKQYIEELIGMPIKVPEFDTSDEMKMWLDDHKGKNRYTVTSDIEDPETGELILSVGDYIDDYVEKEPEPVKKKKSKKSHWAMTTNELEQEYTDAIEAGENIEPKSPEEEYGITFQELEDEYQGMGEDTAGDWLYDNKDADRFDFDQWAQSAAGEFADSQMHDPDYKIHKKFLNAKGVRDANGWIADSIYDGMLKYFKSQSK